MNILVTGVAGFIGMHLGIELLRKGHFVVGLDNCNDYYLPTLKLDRLNELKKWKNFSYEDADIVDSEQLSSIFSKVKFDIVFNMAAQAGVRYSIANPGAYIQSNVVGFGNILEACQKYDVEKLVYASSSSVYGMQSTMPLSEEMETNSPVSLYAATKKSNELMAHSYSSIHGLKTIGVRFFTVYGPWGRPDMAVWQFTESITQGEPIKMYNGGNMLRDFTFIEDIVEGLIGLTVANGEKLLSDNLNYEERCAIYNIGCGAPSTLGVFIDTLEELIGKKAHRIEAPMQKGDVMATFANVEKLRKKTGFLPKVSLKEGLAKWIEWFDVYNKRYSIRMKGKNE